MMRKTLLVIFAVFLVFSLATCGQSAGSESSSIPMASKEEQAAFDAACELMEQERYGEALDAFANIPLYDAIWTKMYEINRLTSSASTSALDGKWYNMNSNEQAPYDKHDYYLEFSGNGRVVFGMKSESGGIALSYSYEGEDLFVTVPSSQTTYRLSVSQIDGITHIRGSISGALDCDFVPAEHYEDLKSDSP